MIFRYTKLSFVNNVSATEHQKLPSKPIAIPYGITVKHCPTGNIGNAIVPLALPFDRPCVHDLRVDGLEMAAVGSFLERDPAAGVSQVVPVKPTLQEHVPLLLQSCNRSTAM